MTAPRSAFDDSTKLIFNASLPIVGLPIACDGVLEVTIETDREDSPSWAPTVARPRTPRSDASRPRIHYPLSRPRVATAVRASSFGCSGIKASALA
jgi:hypothetical protein